jgi:hypothetical protein
MKIQWVKLYNIVIKSLSYNELSIKITLKKSKEQTKALQLEPSLGSPVAHACNPTYSKGQRSGGSWFKASPGK